jgi:glycosyltransferase involved in cell wall biosynthesis
MKVALLTPAYWPELRRGGERLAHDLGASLAARGHDVRLLTSHQGRTTRTREDGIHVVRHRRPPDGRLIRRGYEDHLTHVPFTYLALRRDPPDVVHALHHADAQAAIRSGRPAVWTFLGVPHRSGLANRRLRLDLVTKAIAGSAAVTVLSEAAAREFRRWLGADPRVIHPGVDLDAFTPAGERAEAFTVLCPAALGTRFKRAELLRDAFAIVRRERPGARLIVQRGGPLDREPGVDPRDLDAHAALLRAYREAHVTALSSRGEAFGLVLAESLACGTPAVAAGDAAGPEVLGDAGATFDGDDPRALTTAILDAAAISPATARARAQRFSLERCADAHEALYAEVLGTAERF